MKTLNQLAGEGIQYVVIRIDETQFWKDEIQNKAGKIEGVYLVDLTEPTHLCELAISYPAKQLKNFVQNWESYTEDELTELEHLELRDEYFDGNCRFEISQSYGEDEIMEFEEIYEYEQANPTVC